VQQLLTFLTSAAGFIFIFGVVVLVHELGHFLAAKLTGVYAPRFSVGFGPGPKKRWGETEYQLGLIPLGGYVRMASRDDEATAFLEGGSEVAAERAAQASDEKPKGWDPDAMIPFGPKPVPEHRWFESKSLPQKLLILLAGVSMNALLTVVVIFGLIWTLGNTIIVTRAVGGIQNSPATESLRAQIQPGDTIVSVQGLAVATWNDVVKQLVLAPGETLSITTNRGTFAVPAGPPAGRLRGELRELITPFAPPTIDSAEPGRPAATAGLQKGDLVTAIDGRPVRSSQELVEIISAAPGSELRLTIERNGRQFETSIRTEADTVQDAVTGGPATVGRIGIALQGADVTHEKVGVSEAFVLAVNETGDMVVSILTTLQGLVQNKVSIKQLGGPITIAKASGEAAQQGIVPLFSLLALLSINLAVLNLLPIPVLDGGQILIVVAESVKGSPFSPKARQVILGTGVALVLLLMLAVSYNDVVRLFGG
jgi:regulator of sigma E protease